MKHFKILLSLFFLFVGLLSCHREEDLPEFIEGYVVEQEGQLPIPFAYVVTQKEIFTDLWNTQYHVVDTLRADSNGRFLLNRQKYKDLNEDCSCSFVACGKGADTQEGFSFYEDRCEMANFSSATTSPVFCTSQTMGYLRVFVDDLEPFNPEFNFVTSQVSSVNSSNAYQVYPNPAYNSALGVFFGPYLNHTELTIKLLFSDQNGLIDELEQEVLVHIQGKEILDVHFQY